MSERWVTLPPFTAADQQRFGGLSGDANPVHLDADAARRTIFGRPIVHGMHLTLRALEALASAGSLTPHRELKVRFHRPLFLDEALSIELAQGADAIEIECLIDGTPIASIGLSQSGEVADQTWTPVAGDWSSSPREIPFEATADVKGRLPLPYPASDIRSAFPGVTGIFGVNVVAHLLAITRVIGMEVPGLHSMFATLAVRFLGGRDSYLSYGVKRVKPKLSYVQLEFESGVVSGSAETFVRPVAAAPSFDRIKTEVAAGEFSGRRCLVVGGSRGLGLVAAYLLGAGGAEVTLTYRVGAELAFAAVQMLRANGVTAEALQLDSGCLDSAFEVLAHRRFAPTDLFYFATPHIFLRKTALFERNVFEDFIAAYASNFMDLVQRTKSLGGERLAVFYPSSSAVDQPLRELAEYAAAKAAGEALCRSLSLYDPRLRVFVERLPRLPTDQTATLVNVETQDPAPILADICRKMGRTAKVASEPDFSRRPMERQT